MLLKKQIPFVSSFFFHFYGTIRILSVNPTLLSLTHWPPTRVGPVRLTTKTHSGIFTAACRLTEYFQIFEKNSNVCMSRQFHQPSPRGFQTCYSKIYTDTTFNFFLRFALSNNGKQTRNSFQSTPKHTKSSSLSSELL